MLGEPTLGPLGMLGTLEEQLGLLQDLPSQAARVVQMRNCLQVARTGARFFERSFAADELGTAAILLRWRDQWFEHGWQGSFATSAAAGAPGRLADMAAVEAIAHERVAPGVGQRLAAIAAALQDRRPQIARVLLQDPLEDFPVAWRHVLARLPVEQAQPISALAKPKTALGQLQRVLLQLHAGEAPEPVVAGDDGSLRIVRPESLIAAAAWVAQHLREEAGDVVLVAGPQGGALDAALGALDQPLLGLTPASASRPSLQLLPMALRLLWDPLDYGILLQFLTHPVNPIWFVARSRIADKIATAPGIHGRAWDEVLAEIDVHYGKDAAQVRAQIADWLENERFSPASGVPLTVALARVDLVASFFRGRLGQADESLRSSSQAGFSQAEAVRASLEGLIGQGMARIGPEALDKMVVQATARGSENPLLQAQAGAGAWVDDPAAVIEPFAEVCWWNLAAVPMPAAYPWSPRELAWLQASGVALPPIEQEIARQARNWLRPILSAQRRLTLVLPCPGEEVHPVWLLVSRLLGDRVEHPVESVLWAPPQPRVSSPIDHRALPAPRRWWKLAPGTLGPTPEWASPTSLENLLFNPTCWVLQYCARLQRSSLMELPGENRLLGNLAHRAVERLYREEGAPQWTAAQVEAWLHAHLAGIVRDEGAILLMAGRLADLQAFGRRTFRAVDHLHRLLKQAGAVRVEPEKNLEATTPQGALRGRTDLLVTLDDGRQAIVDLKWSGSIFRKLLDEERHVQLLTYGRMQFGATKQWPALSYFVMRRRELMTTSAGVFPGATIVGTGDGSGARLWKAIAKTWVWRKAQIDKGAIEIVDEGLEVTPESTPPEGGLDIAPPDRRFDPYVNLLGWDA